MNLHRPVIRASSVFLSFGVVMALLSSTPAIAIVAGHSHSSSPKSSQRHSDIVSPCPSSTFCTWMDAGYSGVSWSWSFSDNPHNTWFYVGNSPNDQISSYYANRGWRTGIAKNYPLGASREDQACVLPGHANPNLSGDDWQDGTSANDAISGILFVTNNNNTICPNQW